MLFGRKRKEIVRLLVRRKRNGENRKKFVFSPKDWKGGESRKPMRCHDRKPTENVKKQKRNDFGVAGLMNRQSLHRWCQCWMLSAGTWLGFRWLVRTRFVADWSLTKSPPSSAPPTDSSSQYFKFLHFPISLFLFCFFFFVVVFFSLLCVETSSSGLLLSFYRRPRSSFLVSCLLSRFILVAAAAATEPSGIRSAHWSSPSRLSRVRCVCGGRLTIFRSAFVNIFKNTNIRCQRASVFYWLDQSLVGFDQPYCVSFRNPL